MLKPVAVFDAGIGSYAIVREIQKQMPGQDILYFADRASFPYGSKTPNELLSVIKKTLTRLEAYNPCAIVMASNAPSIMVLEDVRSQTSIPVYGVFPPMQEAVSRSQSGYIGILGVQSLIESPMLATFVKQQAPHPDFISLINASSMVDLVENGAFLFSPDQTQIKVNAFCQAVTQKHPFIDTFTLSSTHLPWLRCFFEVALPHCHFLDPAETLVKQLGPGTKGQGQILGLVTEAEGYDLATFQRMLDMIGVTIPLQLVT